MVIEEILTGGYFRKGEKGAQLRDILKEKLTGT